MLNSVAANTIHSAPFVFSPRLFSYKLRVVVAKVSWCKQAHTVFNSHKFTNELSDI